MSPHCWEDGPREWLDNDTQTPGSTCMLLDGHDGPHEFTPDSELMVSFVPNPEGQEM